jgi:Na+-transporting NADH:ubiquinone oxidoreductase subunit A
MPNTIRIKKGTDIKLSGPAVKNIAPAAESSVYALVPSDFIGLVPKMLVKEGDEVKAGSPIFYDKNDERIVYCAPVSGEIAAVERGEKRKLLKVTILADRKQSSIKHDIPSLASLDGSAVKEWMLKSGLWPMVIQRPYGINAHPDKAPKCVVVSAFDSAPLAPDYAFTLSGKEKELQAGLDALKRLTSGSVYLNVHAKDQKATLFTERTGVTVTLFDGPHPAGNPGVQIHHLNPVNKGETVWTVNVEDVCIIGHFFLTGEYKPVRTVAVGGPAAVNPAYVTTVAGAPLASVISGKTGSANTRVISGNVFTGKKSSADGFLGFLHHQVSLLEEGNQPQFLGWLAPNFHKFSLSKSYFSWLMPNKEYALNTNTNGEERAFVVSGQYEDVLPMDVYPVQLLKAILVEDIEKMEALGIYEVTEEDLALCEVVCTSKFPVQETLRRGLDLAHKELG